MTTMQGTFPRRPDMVTIVREQQQQQQQQAETTQTASEYKTSCSRRSFRSFCRRVRTDGGLGQSFCRRVRSVCVSFSRSLRSVCLSLGLSVCLSLSPVALLVVLVRQIMPIKRWENELATLLHACCLHYAASVWVFAPLSEWGDWKD